MFVFTSIVNISSASVSAASRYVRLSSVAAAMTENRLCPVVIQAKGDRVKKSQKKELTSFKFKNKFFFWKKSKQQPKFVARTVYRVCSVPDRLDERTSTCTHEELLQDEN